MDTAIFWKEAAILSKRVVSRIKLNPQFVGGDIATTREDLEQEGLMAAGEWISRNEKDVAGDTSGLWRTVIHSIIKNAIFSHLKGINRDSGRAFSASDWLENVGDDWGEAAIIKTPDIEPYPEEAAQYMLEAIIETNENSALKSSITCLSKEMQAIVLLHNDGFSTAQIGRRINRHRERARQLYHEAMRKLKLKTQQNKAETELLPLDWEQEDAPQDMLYSTQAEKLKELRYRQRSTRGNISNSTRAMRQAGKGGQLSLF